MVAIRKILYEQLDLDKHKKFRSYKSDQGYIPIMSVNPEKRLYRFNCYCFDCPCNIRGLCSTEFQELPVSLLHEFDGDNIIKNFCG